MTNHKGEEEILTPESTSKSRFLTSIESKNQFLAYFEKFYQTKIEEARRERKNKKKTSYECHSANNIA